MGLDFLFRFLEQRRPDSCERLTYRIVRGKRLRLEPLEDRRMLAITLHVDADAASGGDGLIWETAFQDLQAALSEADIRNSDSDEANDVDAIWIAEGTYLPSELTEPGDTRSASFSLVDGVTLYGGFAGDETTLEGRDWSTHVTTLSGDLGALGDDSDNAYTVVYCGESVEAVLDGVLIIQGNADDTYSSDQPNSCGGGVYNIGVLVVENSTLSDNSANAGGGGIRNRAVLTVTNSTLSDNFADAASGGWGGGIHNSGALTVNDSVLSRNLGEGGGIANFGHLRITDSLLSDNSNPMSFGGAIRNSGDVEVMNTIFTGNSAAMGGGALYSDNALSITNSVFSKNVADEGGAIYSSGGMTVTNTTVWDNSARHGSGGIHIGSEYSAATITPTATLNNTIVAGNESSDLAHTSGTLGGSHNLIGNGEGQSALIDGVAGNQVGTFASPVDPLLRSWIPFGNVGWSCLLLPGSPVIDAGDNDLAVDAHGQPLVEDIFYNPRFQDGTVDIGAVEGLVPERPSQIYTVTSLENTIADDGILTFVEAFAAANQNRPVGDALAGSFTEQDVIQFAEGVSGTVLVDQGELSVHGDLSIEGPGAEMITFDAGGQNRIFSVYEYASVSLSGMTITGGSAAEGGAIYNAGELSVTDSTCVQNESDSGGGIWNASSGRATLASSNFENNNAQNGGAILNSGVLAITNSVLSANSATHDGGGIESQGHLTVTACRFSDNSAHQYGGAIYGRGELSITGSEFSGNTARICGGGLFSESPLFVSDSTFLQNSAARGGAIFGGDELTISDSTLSGNSASDGGAIVFQGNTLTISDTVFAANSASREGGAISNYGVLALTNSTLSGNVAAAGGAIYNSYQSNGTAITRSMLSDNSASGRGGAVFNIAPLTVTNSILARNSASEGGAIFNRRDVEITNSTITENLSRTGRGGGICSEVEYDWMMGPDPGMEQPFPVAPSTVALDNTIVARNTGLDIAANIDDPYYPMYSSEITGSHNLIEDGTGQAGLRDGVDGNQVGTSASPCYPDLSDWTQFDGGSWGYYLLPGSLAINMGDNELAPGGKDILGNPRVQDDTVDIGAVEGATPGTSAQSYTVTSLENAIADDGVLTFIEAFEAANRNQPVGDALAGSYSEQDEILFAETLNGTVLCNGRELSIFGDLRIEGPGVDSLTFDAEGESRVFSTAPGTTVDLSGMAITGGSASEGGGIYNAGTLAVADSTLLRNETTGSGGAIRSFGDFTISNSSLVHNSADSQGGAIFNSGNATVSRSEISGNVADGGGGIANCGGLALVNSTLSGNQAASTGGAIHNSGTHTITNSTLSGNSAGNDFGGVANDGTLTINNSILWSNSGQNVPVEFSGSNNLIDIDPRFVRDPSAGPDGQWATDDDDWGDCAIADRSPAINSGENELAVDAAGNPLAADLAGRNRIEDTTVDCGAYEYEGSPAPGREVPSLVVSTSDDEFDLYDNEITLREAVFYSERNIGDGTITFRPDLDDATIILATGMLRLSHAIVIDGSDLNSLTVDAAEGSRVFGITDIVTLKGLTITGGSARNGGGVYNIGNLMLTNSTISGNSANDYGGGVFSSGALSVNGSTFSRNTAYAGGGVYGNSALVISNTAFLGNSAYRGGGIASDNSLSVVGSVYSGNTATWGGGGIHAAGTLNITNSTFAGNSAFQEGGAILNSGAMTLNNSIVVFNPRDNIEGDYDGSGNLINIKPDFVRAPSSGADGEWGTDDDDWGDFHLTDTSPAINGGDNTLAVDTAGNPTHADLTGDARIADSIVDCGAYEYQGSPAAGREVPSLLITTTHDIFDLYDDSITLREAIYYAEHGVGDGGITFDPALDEATIAVTAGALWISGEVAIDASTLTSLTVDATSQSGVFHVLGDLTLIGVTVTGGSARRGAGIRNYSDGLTISGCTIRDNGASYYGGGMFSTGTVAVTNSVIANNSGGGLYCDGTTTIIASTIANNQSFGIYNIGALTVRNATVAHNSGTGIHCGNFDTSWAAADLYNTIVAKNGGFDIYAEEDPMLMTGGTISGSHNLTGNSWGSIWDGANGNQVGVDPLLGEWTKFDNGLWGYPLLFDSPAIDAGNNALLPEDTLDLDDDGDTTEPLPIDLAGKRRVNSGTVDIGACEFFTPQFVITEHIPQDDFQSGQTDIVLFFNRELTTLSEQDLLLNGPDGEIPITGVSRGQHGNDWSEYVVQFGAITKAGDYQLVVMPTVRDENGELLNQDVDGTPGEPRDDQYSASWKLVGPMVASHQPSATIPNFAPLAYFDITFDTAMEQNSFSLADVLELSGPSGAIEPTGHEWINDNTVRVMFDPMFALGTFSITIGTDVYDIHGNPLDQNQNGIAEEIGDTWTGTVTRSISNYISQDLVIPSLVGTIVFDEMVTIAPGATLTVEPGVTLAFGPGSGVVVQGGLVTLGEVDQPVVFTSSATSPSAGDWVGIRVTSTGSIDLNHAEIRYADTAVDADSEGAQALLKNTLILDGGFGIYVYSPYAEVTAENCVIADNANTGIFVRADSRHSFKNCTVVGNGFGDGGWYGAGIHLGGSILTLENCIVAFNNTGLDHSGDPPTATIRNSLFYNPDGEEITWDGDPGMPDLTTDGNRIANPVFVDRLGGNYELSAGSPAIDAGTGIKAPTTDLFGQPRYDDLGMLNVGNGYPSYVDIGALERQSDSPVADLAVTDVSNPIPDIVSAGQTFDLEWTVRNMGAVETTGTWQDLVYLSSDPYLGGDDILLAAIEHTDPLAVGADYTENLALDVPTTSGPKYLLVHTQLVGDMAHEAVETNNLGIAARVLAVDVPLLELDEPVTATATVEQWDYFRFEATSGHTVLFTLDGDAGISSLYLRQTLPPTWNDNDGFSALSQPDQELRLLEPVDGTYYVGVYTSTLPGSTGIYTLSAELTTLDIRQVSPNEVGRNGTATIRVLGDGFQPDAQVQLIATDDTVIEGVEYYQDSTRLFATFDLDAVSAATGVYDVVVTNPGLESATLVETVTVVNQSNASFDASLSMPAVARPGRVVECHVEYTNDGNVDIPAPVLTLDSGVEDMAWKLPSCGDWVEGPGLPHDGVEFRGTANDPASETDRVICGSSPSAVRERSSQSHVVVRRSHSYRRLEHSDRLAGL